MTRSIQFLNNPKKLFWTKYEDQLIKIAMFPSKKLSLQNNLQTNPLTIASIYSRALYLAKRAVRKLFNTIGGFLDQKSVATFGISCRDSISQNSISSHGIELNLSGLSRYIKYSAKQSFLTSQTCSKVDFSMNQY